MSYLRISICLYFNNLNIFSRHFAQCHHQLTFFVILTSKSFLRRWRTYRKCDFRSSHLVFTFRLFHIVKVSSIYVLNKTFMSAVTWFNLLTFLILKLLFNTTNARLFKVAVTDSFRKYDYDGNLVRYHDG